MNWTLQLIFTINRVAKKYFDHMKNSLGIFEIRVEVGSDIFRLFSFFDKGKLMIILNGFQKKTQKSPKNELVLAETLKKNSISMKKTNNNLTSFTDHLDQQYGKVGTNTREAYEEGFEAFKLGAMILVLRKEQGLTQQQLAEKCGTTKTYISRIENNASDIRLSTLMRIVREGLGGHLRLTVGM
jgi:phage-related protein